MSEFDQTDIDEGTATQSLNVSRFQKKADKTAEKSPAISQSFPQGLINHDSTFTRNEHHQQKLLMNMVIHDLRSPSASVQFTADAALGTIADSSSFLQQMAALNEDDEQFLEELGELSRLAEQAELAEVAEPAQLVYEPDMATPLGNTIINTKLEELTKLQNMAEHCLIHFDSFGDRSLATRFIQCIEEQISGLDQPGPPQASLSVQAKANVIDLEEPKAKDAPSLRLSSASPFGSRGAEEADASLSSSISEASFRQHHQSPCLLLEQQAVNKPRLITALSARKGASLANFEQVPGHNTLQVPMGRVIQLKEYFSSRSSCFGGLDSSVGECLQPALSSAASAPSAAGLPLKTRLSNLQLKWRSNIEIRSLTETLIVNQIEKLEKALRSCQCSSSILLNLINDLLDMAKAESRTLALTNSKFSLPCVIREAIDTLEFLKEQKKIQLEVVMDDSLISDLARCYGDGDRIRQVLVNLLSNALKFTDEGGSISIEVESKPLAPIIMKSTDAQVYETKIRVTDSGQGISREGLAKLFQNFSALQEHRGCNSRGTGLGLSICKMLIEKMDGTIDVDSKLGKGTTFEINLPLQVLPFHTDDSCNSSVRGQSESFQISELALLEPLSNFGKNSESRSRQIARNATQTPPPLLNLKDLKPCSDHRKMEESKHSKGGRSPATVSAHWKRRQQLQLPLILPLNSPLNRSRTISAASHHSRTPKSQNFFQAFSEACSGIKVLLANDEPVALMAQEQMFKEQLAVQEVDVAPNGQRAIQAAQEKKYDLILLDLHMPVMGGMEAASEIRKLDSTVPIVAVTASTITPELEAECRQAGFNQWLTVPLSYDKLSDIVRELGKQ